MNGVSYIEFEKREMHKQTSDEALRDKARWEAEPTFLSAFFWGMLTALQPR